MNDYYKCNYNEMRGLAVYQDEDSNAEKFISIYDRIIIFFKTNDDKC